MTDDRKAVRVRIDGMVQGVGFRVWTRGEAERLGLTGWVCNEDDGSVSAVVAGSEAAISTMLEKFRKGPPGASVSHVDTEDISDVERPSGFRITN
ncbi:MULTISPECIES: acylphosphatase [unclassified Sinorhizobium]|uniref:acylphosphatase n=1 Tax=unclassified Sinorhizobium TaxID=2613772 RepID=UPI003525B5D0